MSDIAQFNPPTMAAPGGHYSHSVAASGLVFVSGQLPIRPDGTKLNAAPFEEHLGEMAGLVDFSMLGGVIPKTVTQSQRIGNKPPR